MRLPTRTLRARRRFPAGWNAHLLLAGGTPQPPAVVAPPAPVPPVRGGRPTTIHQVAGPAIAHTPAGPVKPGVPAHPRHTWEDRPAPRRRRGARRDRPASWTEAVDARDRITVNGFMRRVRCDQDTGCWLWTGALNPEGYGKVKTGSRTTGRRDQRAHRVAYERLVGPIPVGLHVDHLCHNEAAAVGTCDGGPSCPHRACVNPDHLEPVGSGENSLRSALTLQAINRAKTHCLRGHEFTPENTYVNPQGRRTCRTCSNARSRKYRRGRAAAVGPLVTAAMGALVGVAILSLALLIAAASALHGQVAPQPQPVPPVPAGTVHLELAEVGT